MPRLPLRRFRALWLLPALLIGSTATRVGAEDATATDPDPDRDPRTARVRTLLVQPEAQRDEAWTASFYEAVAHAPLFATALEPSLGPDGFPYLPLYTQTDSDSVAVVTIEELLPQLTEVGVGIVLDPAEGSVGWVFHYGDLVCQRLYGRFEVAGSSVVAAVAASATPTEVTTPQGEVLVAAPSEGFLPLYVRAVLRNFFQSALGIQEPAVVLLQRGEENAPPELAFNIFAEGFDKPEQMQALLLDLTWFLPRHYYVTALSARALPKESFVRL